VAVLGRHDGGDQRLENLQFCIEQVIRDQVPGDLIETGVWRGGACIFMCAVLAVHGEEDRRVFVADSFDGLPKPDIEKYPQANFSKYGLLSDRVVVLKGWFKDTLPTAPIQTLAILRLDGDMYQSTMDVLNALYAKLSPGGFCIIDDYALPTCKRAVDDFRAQQKIEAPLLEVDWTGRYWRK